MRATAPVDDLPFFKGPSLNASNLMIEANALRARGKHFDAAICFWRAGQQLHLLFEQFVAEGYYWHAFQSSIEASECYLEIGDDRSAEHELTQLSELIAGSRFSDSAEDFSAKLAALRQLIFESRLEREKILETLRDQMGEPSGAKKLKRAWLDEQLETRPGVVELHWFASQKALADGKPALASPHLEICTTLAPRNFSFWFVRIIQLAKNNNWAEAESTCDSALLELPNEPLLLWASAWVIGGLVNSRKAPAARLERAVERADAAIRLGLQPEHVVVLAMMMKRIWLKRLGRIEDADQVWNEAQRKHPVATAQLTWLVERVTQAKIESYIYEEAIRATRGLTPGAA